MSLNTVETFLHRLGNDRAVLAAFGNDPEEVLSEYPLSAAEREYILTWDLRAIIDMGVSPMVLMFAYTSAHGGPENSRDDYVAILNSPRRVTGANLT